VNFLNIFNSEIGVNKYKRIDSSFKVNIFLGYNENNNMSMVIIENGPELMVKSSAIIDVNLKRREDNKMALSFDLLENRYHSVFLVFCKDIIMNCNKLNNDSVIDYTVKRWNYWKGMFNKPKNTFLEYSEIKGLIGELILLKDFFLENWEEFEALNSWMGPIAGKKDFEIGETWYEVKTVSSNSIAIKISSLEQLESERDGHLFIVKLDDTSSESEESLNLNRIVSEVAQKINDIEALNLYKEKLDQIGYCFDIEYDKYSFLFKETKKYYVNEDFPKISRKKISSSIGDVKYTINIEGIQNFIEV
jgi:hypothetical protein